MHGIVPHAFIVHKLLHISCEREQTIYFVYERVIGERTLLASEQLSDPQVFRAGPGEAAAITHRKLAGRFSGKLLRLPVTLAIMSLSCHDNFLVNMMPSGELIIIIMI